MRVWVNKLVESLVGLAAMVGLVAASAEEITWATALIAGVCAGIVLGAVRFGVFDEVAEQDVDLFGEPFDPAEVLAKPGIDLAGGVGR